MKKEDKDMQMLTDLVGVHVLTQIAYHSKAPIAPPADIVEADTEEAASTAGGHHSDSEETVEKSFGFYLRLAKLLRRFFGER
ncbi:MAG: hypothetical protein AAGG68_26995 [Bacteroidota bacterium]